MTTALSAQELAAIRQKLPYMSEREKADLLRLLDTRARMTRVVSARQSLIGFAREMYPGYKVGGHHRKLASLFEDIAAGKKRRVIVNVAPRMGKSEITSYLFPAWYLGQHPDRKIIMATHTSSLSELFGRRVRNLIASKEYEEVFAETTIAEDSKSAGAWSTSRGGQYYAVGVGGALAGRGADLLVIDDPHALPLDTEVPTPQGFRTIGELAVGDEVFGPDGLPVRVVAKSAVWRDRELYRVTTNDGEVVHCDAGHLWAYRSDTNLKKARIVNATARELAQWDKPNKPCMPRHAAVRYPHAALPVDPYVLGAWLGDGTTGLGRMTAHPDDAGFMREQFHAAGYETTTLTDAYSFGVRKLRAQLRDLGVLYDKHIPQAYLTASVEQRMALLQGLMDTDGTVTTAGQCSFQNTNQRLVEQVRELLHSLGAKPRLLVYYDNRQRHASRKADYRVNFKLRDAARMPRKQERTFTASDKQSRSFTVERTQLRADVQCITVDRPDGLFLVGRGYVVTHNSEQDVKSGTGTAFDAAYEWYQTGPRQRLMPGGAIVIVQTRWGAFDLTGRLIDYAAKNPGADQWEVVEFPAILHENEFNEKSLWPEQWPLEELKRVRESIDPRYWAAQYQQQPMSESAQIIKYEDWRIWEGLKPPQCSFIIHSWDTAFETKNSADYSAFTCWGVFEIEDQKTGKTVNNLILLDAFKRRMEFPELKATVVEHYKEWKPDILLVEKRASGASLIQELRLSNIPVSEFTPARGKVGQSNDKIARANSVSDLFRSGVVWCPDTRWANEVRRDCADFPVGMSDDLVDSTVQALIRFREGGLISVPSDDELDDWGSTALATRRPRYY